MHKCFLLHPQIGLKSEGSWICTYYAFTLLPICFMRLMWMTWSLIYTGVLWQAESQYLLKLLLCNLSFFDLKLISCTFLHNCWKYFPLIRGELRHPIDTEWLLTAVGRARLIILMRLWGNKHIWILIVKCQFSLLGILNEKWDHMPSCIRTKSDFHLISVFCV